MATEVSLINYTNEIVLNVVEINNDTSIEFVDNSQPVEVSVVVLGKATSDKHFVHTQTEPSSTWVISHSLNKYPAVEVVDTAHDVVVGEVSYDSLSQITITFVYNTTGKAFLN